MINRLRTLLVVVPIAAATVSAYASSSPASSSPPATVSAASTSQRLTYVSVKGDSFTSVSEKFGCTIRALKKLNGIKGTHLHVGTTLEIPVSKSLAARNTRKKSDKKAALADALPKKIHHFSPVAQPVQDFDVAPSVYASCPPPPSSGSADDDEATPPAPAAPGEQQPVPLAGDHRTSLLPVPSLTPALQPASPSTTVAANPLLLVAPPKKSFASALADFFGGSSSSASESGEWGNRFLVETRNLAAQGSCYDGSWRPDGDSHRWEMDCSNTTRYLYEVTAGIELPRTASDQYYYLHLQDKAWDVPMTASGFADTNFLRGNLKPGDLLFWENTYRPERQPPITHVMIYLGTDARGRWLMAGSQGSRGFYNRRHSGPDVYVFDPTHAVGGYTTWLGLVHHHGRFVAFGRPLEADVKKLSVAADE
jgi:cell wall-associated NlpC family hydrolase